MIIFFIIINICPFNFILYYIDIFTWEWCYDIYYSCHYFNIRFSIYTSVVWFTLSSISFYSTLLYFKLFNFILLSFSPLKIFYFKYWISYSSSNFLLFTLSFYSSFFHSQSFGSCLRELSTTGWLSDSSWKTKTLYGESGSSSSTHTEIYWRLKINIKYRGKFWNIKAKNTIEFKNTFLNFLDL